jgi:hypothetical protein
LGLRSVWDTYRLLFFWGRVVARRVPWIVWIRFLTEFESLSCQVKEFKWNNFGQWRILVDWWSSCSEVGWRWFFLHTRFCVACASRFPGVLMSNKIFFGTKNTSDQWVFCIWRKGKVWTWCWFRILLNGTLNQWW